MPSYRSTGGKRVERSEEYFPKYFVSVEKQGHSHPLRIAKVPAPLLEKKLAERLADDPYPLKPFKSYNIRVEIDGRSDILPMKVFVVPTDVQSLIGLDGMYPIYPLIITARHFSYLPGHFKRSRIRYEMDRILMRWADHGYTAHVYLPSYYQRSDERFSFGEFKTFLEWLNICTTHSNNLGRKFSVTFFIHPSFPIDLSAHLPPPHRVEIKEYNLTVNGTFWVARRFDNKAEVLVSSYRPLIETEESYESFVFFFSPLYEVKELFQTADRVT